ncbi:UDP-2,4-diacetamido-2,4,6-trideoxy-beta-L-altropyranose hydrolase [Rubripirellula amarantea]|uniref:UDP-2,4-diacetamido-2,4, 6-trideoxy-beta-L-altropyranose hydrolase n=1 Tax=Rubripirellula amarantea TaxID=2527999 RepID=A0A5C5WSD5_9BACT|nr:UDP-2,4-diacetamido-2,4,6-trideoxy-beta-L-altropyranose hydrolase [Rubripirellula amarantea]TWT53716.1 UDP-2,4-diacetamido-2,4,6-trideoxy-beta-L-altropyranose hydrolase [Rubripirellula amarantea]
MRVLFRADASLRIGSGHIARCLTLADAITAQGGQADFVCRDHPGHLATWIESRGYEVSLLETETSAHENAAQDSPYASWLAASSIDDARQTINACKSRSYDWTVVDHYAIDSSWHHEIRKHIPKTLVIDDLANRSHEADLLLDQNYHKQQQGRYESWVNQECELLLGPKFSLLRPDFAKHRDVASSHVGASKSKETQTTKGRFNRGFAGEVRADQSRSNQFLSNDGSSDQCMNIMVFMGGMDEHNVTARVIKSLEFAGLESSSHLHVVIGSANPHRELLKAQCDRVRQRNHFEVSLHIQVSEMAKLMSKMTCMIGAGGSNTWERCCLGIPTAVIAVAENQVDVAVQLDETGISQFLGFHRTIQDRELRESLQAFVVDRNSHHRMHQRSRSLVDGLGANRIVGMMNQRTAKIAA